MLTSTLGVRVTAGVSRRRSRHLETFLLCHCFVFDLHDFRASSVFKRNPITHVCGEEGFADWRNPTDGVRSRSSSSTPTTV